MNYFLPTARPALPRLFVLLVTLLLAGPGRGWAQVPTFVQAESFNPGLGRTYSQGRAIATDAAGNQYLTGSFSGALVLGTITLAGAGIGDVFVAKRSASGAWLWAVSVGASGNDAGRGIAVDAGGNVLVTGFFEATVSFATSPAPTVLVAVGQTDMFVAKFGASTGACAWATGAGGGFGDSGNGVAVDAGGNALVTGIFYDTARFGTGAAPVALTGASRAGDAFVAKFGAGTGACAWAVGAGGGYTTGNAVAVDAGGNALVTGTFTRTARFATSPAATALASAGSLDVFVAKFGAGTGACAWAVQAGGIDNDVGRGIAVDAGGNALVTGLFEDRADFATGSAPIALLTAGWYDVFVAKFGATAGACAWAARAGGRNYDMGNAVAVDVAGNALVTGSFDSTAGFATSPAPTALVSAGEYDMFVAKFGAGTGACTWAVRAGGRTFDYGLGIAVDRSGNALVAGIFQASASFGSLALVGAGSSLADTGYVAVLAGAGTLTTAAAAALPAFTLFPNPARSACQVQGAAAGAAVAVYDALGRALARARTNASGTASLALPAGLAPGLYLVRCGGQVRRLAVE